MTSDLRFWFLVFGSMLKKAVTWEQKPDFVGNVLAQLQLL